MRILSLTIGPRQRDVLLLIIAAVLAIFVYVGCGGDPSDPDPVPCTVEDNCEIGQVCDTSSGDCVEMCSDRECSSGVCGNNGLCTQGDACSNNEDCPLTQVCNNNVCEDSPSCEGSGEGQCDAGYSCDNEICTRSDPGEPSPCIPGDCPVGQVCVSGICGEVACGVPGECDIEAETCECDIEAHICDGVRCVPRCNVFGCPGGLVCDSASDTCGLPCESDCSEGEVCNFNTGECQGPLNFASNPQPTLVLSPDGPGELPEIDVRLVAEEGELEAGQIVIRVPGGESGFAFNGFVESELVELPYPEIGALTLSSGEEEQQVPILALAPDSAFVDTNLTSLLEEGLDPKVGVRIASGHFEIAVRVPLGGDRSAAQTTVPNTVPLRLRFDPGPVMNPSAGLYEVVILVHSVDPNSGTSGDDGVGTSPVSTSFVQMVTIPSSPSEDSDGDGVNNDVDQCPNSDLNGTVKIGECDSGVTNHLGQDGCSIADRINDCDTDAANHGQFVECVTDSTNELNKQGVISENEKGRIVSCAARSKH